MLNDGDLAPPVNLATERRMRAKLRKNTIGIGDNDFEIFGQRRVAQNARVTLEGHEGGAAPKGDDEKKAMPDTINDVRRRHGHKRVPVVRERRVLLDAGFLFAHELCPANYHSAAPPAPTSVFEPAAPDRSSACQHAPMLSDLRVLLQQKSAPKPSPRSA
jgi:hypothetical protein